MPLAVSSYVNRTSVRPDVDGKCAVAFELVASGEPVEGRRPSSRTVLALDVSLSMKGEPLDQVIRSVDRILDALGPDDEIGIVAFAENATRVVEPVKVDAAGKRRVRSRVGGLFVESSTNIEAGLDLAAAMLEGASMVPGQVLRRGVVLLSDGAPNVGAHTSELLREVVRRHRPNVSFFSLGYGVDHAEDVLSAIGEAGGGGYEFVQDPTSCARAFARALGAQGDVVAGGIELIISPADGVELVRFVGREQTRFSREGILVSLPDMVNGARRLVVAELSVRRPGAECFAIDVVEAKVRWRGPTSARDALSTSPVATLVCGAHETPSRRSVSLEIAERASAVVVEAERRILLARADEARESARGHADRGQFGAAATTIRALMAEIAQLPGWVMNDGTPLAEAYELLVDEAMAFEKRPDAEAYAAFRKAAVNSKLTTAVPSAAKSRGDASQKLIEHVAGDRPAAWLVRIDEKSGDGYRHALEEECVIGRTSDADICVADSAVSRRHAEIFANAGEYWVADLGSTNPTLVNDRPLGRAPHKLQRGDVVRVGAVKLRYDEGERRLR